MKFFVIAATLLFVSTSVHAQQQPSTALDRISLSLGQCVGTAERQADQIADLQKQLMSALAKIKPELPAAPPPEK